MTRRGEKDYTRVKMWMREQNIAPNKLSPVRSELRETDV